MLLNLLNSDNYIDVNKTAIQTFGINTAVYVSVLLNVYNKAIRKDKLVDGCIKLTRKYMTDMTTLSNEEQLSCDRKLMSLGIISKEKETGNLIKFNIDNYVSVIGTEDAEAIKELKQKVEDELSSFRASQKNNALNGISLGLRNSIHYTDFELVDAMGKWIDVIVKKFGGRGCNQEMVFKFQSQLNDFAKGDFDTAMRVIEIATIKEYKECEWAINLFRREQFDKQKNSSSARVTIQKRATKNTISDETY